MVFCHLKPHCCCLVSQLVLNMWKVQRCYRGCKQRAKHTVYNTHEFLSITTWNWAKCGGDLNMSVGCLFRMRAELLFASLYNSYWKIRPTADVSLARTHAFINWVLIGFGNSKQCGQRYLDPVVLNSRSVWEQWVLISSSSSRLSSAFKLSISDWSPLQGLTLLTRADTDAGR